MKKLFTVARARMNKRRDGIGGARGEEVVPAAPREEGAILILALTYLVAVGLIVALLSTWAINDLNNSSHFRAASSLTLAATDMTDVAIQYIRYNPSISTSQPVAPYINPAEACWGGDASSISDLPVIDGDQVAVWCSTEWNPLNQLLSGIPNVTRDVTFYACSTAVSVSAVSCENNPLLTAEVDFDDYPPAPARSAPIQTLCSVYCGSGMEIASWQWGSSSTGAASGPARTLSFSSEPSDTSAMATTDASVYVTDANTNPVAGDMVTIAQQSGPTSGTTPPVPGINSTNSTLTAVTNSQGVAVFTNINPAYAGNYTLIASDGNGQTVTSTNFVVSMQRDVITTPSAPTDATANSGKTFNPSTGAKDISNAPITVTLDAQSSGCSLSGGVVTFTAPGTCVLDYNDNGNATYAPALQATLSFPVGGQSATQVALTLDNKAPAASATTNVTITVALENSVGVQVPSSGTTTVVLSDIGNGFFSASKGGASSSAINVVFANGASTATAYFGDENTGPDTISAEYGTTDWGSATLTVSGGAPALVAISPSPSSPAVSSVTNTTLSLQLEDKWGNPATSTGTTTLTLSDSGNGFFAASNGTTGTATLNITFSGGAGTATAYFGNKTSGSDTISAQNGASAWGTSTLSLVAGPATTAQVTLSPAPSKTTFASTTVTIQLVDQYGNDVTTSGVSLTLTESPASSGFFSATSNNKGGTSTLPLTTTSGVAKGYFGDDSAVADIITVAGPGFTVSTPSFVP